MKHDGKLANELDYHLSVSLGQDSSGQSHHYLYRALALTVRDRLIKRWRDTRAAYQEQDRKVVNYVSLEFLMGRSLHNSLLNLDIEKSAEKVLQRYACTLEELESEERDAGLGNGGLGRLAACFLDSCATLEIPVTGYGIRYQYGMFLQKIQDGYQVETPDTWLRNGFIWEMESPEDTRSVSFYGHTEHRKDSEGNLQVEWLDTEKVYAVPYDVPIPGYKNNTVNTLRLWKSEATDEFNLMEFNAGSYTDAVAAKNSAEQITMVLYPNDASEQGKELRLKQQYFLASASLQDVVGHWVSRNGRQFDQFASKNGFQLNDTHPAIAVPELMRLLLDEYQISWDKAWKITTETMAYTNHTLLPEALETWSVRLMGLLVPRIMEIIYEINARFLSEVAAVWPGDIERQRRLSIIAEDGEKSVRMAYLAIVGSHSVNGVAALHTELLKQGLFKDFYDLWPQKFNNKTNGVTPRRWLSHCNPGLRKLLNKTIGEGWPVQLSELKKLIPFAEDPDFVTQFMAVKRANKLRLAHLVQQDTGVEFNVDFMFDVQVKRIHEYKRQLLNVLHVIHLYDRIVNGDTHGMQPRCVLIGGKAAPGYYMAKLIIKLIGNVASVVNRDPLTKDWLRVAFLPNYRVSSMEVICPGTDLSEQISTAGKEASGTGNMKFMMNGAVTIGTLDGANIEIREAVGADNFFLFGLNAEEVSAHRAHYDPQAIIAADDGLNRVLSLLRSGHFNLFEGGVFDPIIDALVSQSDPWMTVADFRSYIDAQQRAGAAYQEVNHWGRMALLNTACSGEFSSDRTISQYRDDIWGN